MGPHKTVHVGDTVVVGPFPLAEAAGRDRVREGLGREQRRHSDHSTQGTRPRRLLRGHETCTSVDRHRGVDVQNTPSGTTARTGATQVKRLLIVRKLRVRCRQIDRWTTTRQPNKGHNPRILVSTALVNICPRTHLKARVKRTHLQTLTLSPLSTIGTN